jgi:ATP/maltotriose-dependent transcriptional regulator MalT
VEAVGVAERGREAFARRAWTEAFAAFTAADAEAGLAPDDRERLALAASLIGHDEVADAALERAHADHLANGAAEAAARAAFWFALRLTLRGEQARGAGWFARSERALDDAGAADSVWRGYLLVPVGMTAIFGGDPTSALDTFTRAMAIAKQHDDVDLRTFAAHGHGQALVASGDIEAGLAELDEVMVGVTTDAVSPQIVGLVYCSVIETCRDCFDLRRGREWTDALTRWCAQQPDLVPYRGQCLVHRAEILQVHGSWPDALDEIARLCARFTDPPTEIAAGMAFYERGELHRLRGEYGIAEDAYRRAARCGHDPQPGLALLRLAQRQVAPALAAIRRALDEAGGGRSMPRLRLLPAHVEIALAAGDVPLARRCAEELMTTAAAFGAPMLRAAGLQAMGAVLLAEDEPQQAVATLRRAWQTWQDIGAPYEAARSRELIGLGCRALGDEDGAGLELDSARWAYEQLGAAPDRARVAALSRAPHGGEPPCGLTMREVQVLRLVATGATNRGIARDLFLSEKTVARHVANIFTKLEVSSRSAATAFAYERNLV